ncbi:MAG: TRAP transporter small permease subunit [bacterium]
MSLLKRIANAIDLFNDWIGRSLAWLTLGMVLVTFVVVLMRYVFGLGSTILQESVVYMHAIVFMVVAGYALVYNGHVRCDIFYGAASARTKAIIDLIEGSPEGRMGIPAVFLLKSLILVFAGLLALQAVSLVVQSALFLAGATPSRGRVDGDEGTGT